MKSNCQSTVLKYLKGSVTKVLIKPNLETDPKTNKYHHGNHFLRKMACESAECTT